MDNMAPAYTITNVQDTSGYNETGRVVRQKRVTVRFADGQSSYVEIPFSQYTPETVKELAEELANQHYAVMGIQGDQIPRPQRPGTGYRPPTG